MKFTKYLYLLLIPAVVACEEVIELDLNDSEPKLVVEATLTNSVFNNQVLLSQSGSYVEPGEYPRISGAEVAVRDASGQTYAFTEGGQAGVYQLEGFAGEVGQSYELSVSYEGEQISGQALLPEPIRIDSFSFEPGPDVPFREPGLLMAAHISSSWARKVSVRFLVQKNGQADNGWYLYQAELAAGKAGVYRFLMLNVAEGDQLEVVAAAVDEEVYAYYNQLSEASGDAGGGFGPATTPANPTSNLSGGVLGYFGALGLSSAQVVVP